MNEETFFFLHYFSCDCEGIQGSREGKKEEQIKGVGEKGEMKKRHRTRESRERE